MNVGGPIKTFTVVLSILFSTTNPVQKFKQMFIRDFVISNRIALHYLSVIVPRFPLSSLGSFPRMIQQIKTITGASFRKCSLWNWLKTEKFHTWHTLGYSVQWAYNIDIICLLKAFWNWIWMGGGADWTYNMICNCKIAC